MKLDQEIQFGRKNQWFWRIGMIVMVTLFSLPTTGRADATVYTDALAAGWQDWSWGEPTRNFTNSTPIHSGGASIAVTYTAGWSGFLLGQTTPIDITGLDTLRFWAHGGTSGGQPVNVTLCIAEQTCMQHGPITLQANTWTQVDVPVTELGNKVWSFLWFNNSDQAQPTFYLDDIAFVASGALPPAPTNGPALTVNASADQQHPISPYIVYPIKIYTIPINPCLVLLSNVLRNSIESQLSLAAGVSP